MSVSKIYLDPTVNTLENIDRLINHGARTTKEAENAQNALTNYNLKGKTILAVAAIVATVALSTILGVVVMPILGLVTSTLILFPISRIAFFVTERNNLATLYQRKLDSTLNVYAMIENYFNEKRTEREEKLLKDIVPGRTKSEVYTLLQRDQEINEPTIKLARSIFNLPTPSIDFPSLSESKYYNAYWQSDRWKELKEACKIYVKPSLVNIDYLNIDFNYSEKVNDATRWASVRNLI